MKKIKLSQFIGRQLSRLKAGQTYYMIVVSTITALGIMKMAFPDISIWVLLLLFPFVIIGAFFMGYLLDIWNVITMDYQKSIEMTQRYLTTVDNKNNAFRKIQIETIVECFKALQENIPIDSDIFEKKEEKFRKDWNPPKEK